MCRVQINTCPFCCHYAEVWAGYTGVLAHILREERSARDAARVEVLDTQAKLDAALVGGSGTRAETRLTRGSACKAPGFKLLKD